MNLPFLKMHGLGNDFIILDGRDRTDIRADKAFLQAIADRKRGIGCDQIIILRAPKLPTAHVYMEMYNADSSVVRACGNATRCVARLLFSELGRKDCVIETVAGLLPVYEESPGFVAVDFGKPLTKWGEIPLAQEVDTLHVALTLGVLSDPCCVNMGNPHAVFFVQDAAAIALHDLGPQLEHHALFPDRCNIEAVQVLAPDRIRLRVWERGTGITEACGTAACATLVAAVRRGLSARRATIEMDGGEVIVEWKKDDHVLLIGKTALTFQGTLQDEAFSQARAG